jgi:hypothetical protein
MKYLVVLCVFFTVSWNAQSQTHKTLYGEKCWIIKTVKDPLGTHSVVVIDEEEKRKRILELLSSKDKNKIITTLQNEGFRVEIFRQHDLEILPKKEQ